MGNISLKARSALNEAAFNYAGFSIRERSDIKLLSVAATSVQKATASSALQAQCGVNWPDIMQSTSQSNTHCLGLQAEQVFILSQHSDDEHTALAKNLAEQCVVTDQSDSWVTLEVSGERTRDVLERICPIDLNEATFSDGCVARTTMEHLGVIIFRQGESYLMLSARSSADSFLHSLTQSADFVI